MSAITGMPSDRVFWSELELFSLENIEKTPRAFRGVYLIRLKHPGQYETAGEVVYVGVSLSSIRTRLRKHFKNKGNEYVFLLAAGNPRGLWFQYAACEDPENAEAWFIQLFEPICNCRDESPKHR